MNLIPLLLYLVVMLYITYRVGKNKNNNNFIEEYFIGGRSMGGVVLAMTIIATYVGASSFISGPGMAYKLGLGWVLLACIQIPTAFLTLGILGKKMAIIGRRINGVTISDFLRARYDNELVVVLGSIAMVIFFIGAVVVQFVGGARLLQSISGIPYHWGLLIFVLIVTGYTTFGGFRAVTITDAIQGFVMLLATFILFFVLLKKGNGMENIIQNIANINPDLLTPTSGGNIPKPFILSFWMLVGVAVLGLPPTSVRCMGFKDTKSMHNAMIIGTSVLGFIMIGMHLIGVMGIAIQPGILISDTAIPILALNSLPGVFAGIFIAGPLAAIMSTIDSLMILSAGTIVKDLYLHYILKMDTLSSENNNNKIVVEKVRKISLITSFSIGTIAFLLALNPPEFLVILNLLFIAGQEAIFFCPIVFGLYWKRANSTGALSAMIIGFLSYIYLFIEKKDIFGLHPIVPVIFLAIISFIIGSYVGKPTSKEKIKVFFED